jgi:hypothetical protein
MAPTVPIVEASEGLGHLANFRRRLRTGGAVWSSGRGVCSTSAQER